MPPTLTIGVARSREDQQSAIERWTGALGGRSAAVVVEAALHPLQAPAGVEIVRLASGCVCCTGLLPMKVTMTRLLRHHRPQAVQLLVASGIHLESVEAMIRREFGSHFARP